MSADRRRESGWLIAKAEASGGSIAVPKMPIPGMGWLAYCKDTEGNIFGMMQEDPEANKRARMGWGWDEG